MSEPSAQKDEPQRDDHEPSMDDILASIRKIISEDDVGDADSQETPQASIPDSALAAEAESELVPSIQDETAVSDKTLPGELTGEDIDFHFEDLLIPDVEGDENSEAKAEELSEGRVPNVPNTEVEMERPPESADSSSPLSVSEEDIDLDTLNLEADILTEFAAFDETLDLVAVSDIDITLTPEINTSEIDTSVQDAVSTSSEPITPDMSTTTDMDVVKSLMEDLTEDTSFDVQADDILSEALGALDTEISSADPVSAESETSHDVDALLEIARRAETDAQQLQASAKADIPPNPAVIPTLPDPDVKETMDMPPAAQPAAQSDRILDDVTENVTTEAFASLTKAVEEQAVINESGPRIGDLVQDAMRPMIKEWLDANLKGIVERAVAKEVKRIASGK